MKIRFFVIIVVCSALLFGQLPDETSGRVPELDAFHKPIFALWHEAWPAKDIQTLKELFPQIDSAFKTLTAATLPGILRDKQMRWDEKKGELRSAVDEYRQSAKGNDTSRILRAAENVHMLYEHMVRIVRPVTQQIDDFHRVLYSLHHYYLPEKNITMIKANAEDLANAMNAVDTVMLSKRLEKKKDQYEKRRGLLSDAVKNYVAAVRTSKPIDALIKLESVVHSRYQMVEKVFE
ncbi:MAG TPA: hypothetical protein DCQ28_03270 [Bacteroidetes bacterium]|nr:hypothetical protein [Bacteroidota bacterium]